MSDMCGAQSTNAIEEAAQRYWKASRMWNDREPCDWTVGDMIFECRQLMNYRGVVAGYADRLLHNVVHQTEPQAIQSSSPTTINLGQ